MVQGRHITVLILLMGKQRHREVKELSYPGRPSPGAQRPSGAMPSGQPSAIRKNPLFSPKPRRPEENTAGMSAVEKAYRLAEQMYTCYVGTRHFRSKKQQWQGRAATEIRSVPGCPEDAQERQTGKRRPRTERWPLRRRHRSPALHA